MKQPKYPIYHYYFFIANEYKNDGKSYGRFISIMNRTVEPFIAKGYILNKEEKEYSPRLKGMFYNYIIYHTKARDSFTKNWRYNNNL